MCMFYVYVVAVECTGVAAASMWKTREKDELKITPRDGGVAMS